MSTRLLDVQRDDPPAGSVELGGDERLLVLVWDGDTPLGTLVFRPDGGRVAGGVIARDVARAFPLPAPPAEAAGGMLPPVSVVVCTCGRPDDLSRCLGALENGRLRPAEVVVVDNAPEDPATRELLRERFPGCRYVSEGRRGVAFARNRGIAEARGEVIAFVDDDCVPSPGWLRALAAAFAREPGLGCCTGPVLPAELKTRAQVLMEGRGGFARGFARQLFTLESGSARWSHFPLQAWIFGSGGNMAFRRTVLAAVGGFDEVLPTAEDLDMFFRVVRAGYPLIYEPQAAVRHRHVREEGALRRRLSLWGRGYVAYLAKVALEDPLYRRRALGEIGGWLSYQLCSRLFGPEGEGFPRRLILAEIAGGISGGPDYLRRRMKALGFRRGFGIAASRPHPPFGHPLPEGEGTRAKRGSNPTSGRSL